MKINPPYEDKVSSQYGAPMGRRSSEALTGKLYLRHAPLHDGYDKGGAYWGWPSNLYCAWNDDCVYYVRASSREAAKTEILQEFSAVTFYK